MWYLLFMGICSITRANHRMDFTQNMSLYILSIVAIFVVYAINQRARVQKLSFLCFLIGFNTMFMSWNYEIWRWG